MSLSVIKLRVISCDDPSCAESFDLSGSETVYHVRYMARQEGWTFRGGGPSHQKRDYCPTHSALGDS